MSAIAAVPTITTARVDEQSAGAGQIDASRGVLLCLQVHHEMLGIALQLKHCRLRSPAIGTALPVGTINTVTAVAPHPAD